MYRPGLVWCNLLDSGTNYPTNPSLPQTYKRVIQPLSKLMPSYQARLSPGHRDHLRGEPGQPQL